VDRAEEVSDLVEACAEDEALGLVPIMVDGGSRGGGERPAGGSLTLEIDGIRVLVPAEFDAAHLGRVIAAIRGTA
jgi:transposase